MARHSLAPSTCVIMLTPPNRPCLLRTERELDRGKRFPPSGLLHRKATRNQSPQRNFRLRQLGSRAIAPAFLLLRVRTRDIFDGPIVFSYSARRLRAAPSTCIAGWRNRLRQARSLLVMIRKSPQLPEDNLNHHARVAV